MEQFKGMSSSLKNDWPDKCVCTILRCSTRLVPFGWGYGGLSNTHRAVYARKYCNNCFEMNHNLCVERSFKTAEKMATILLQPAVLDVAHL